MKEILTESQIYRNLYQVEVAEEVEIATEYFYSEGINEFGIDLLIDELGIDAFAEFVYDIAEQYELTEARRSGRIEPVTKTGKPIGSLKGGAKSAAIRAKQKEKAARDVTSDRPSGMTAALKSQSQKAVKTAAAKQKPTRSETPKQAKQGIASKIGSALKFAADRAKKDTEMLKKSYQTARSVGKGHEQKVAKAAGTVAGAAVGAAKAAHRAGQEFAKSETGKKLKAGLEKTAKATVSAAGAGAGSIAAGKTPAQAAGRAAGTFVRKMRAEGYDDFDIVLGYLIAEDFAETDQAALAIMANMSEEWKQSILDEEYQ